MANYGRHISFPFRSGPDGMIATTNRMDEHVRDEIIQLVLTNLGERAFLPDFGGNIKRMVFENASEASAGLAKATLSQAFSRWLGHRASVEELEVNLVDSKIEIHLKYKIKGSDDTRALRFEKELSV